MSRRLDYFNSIWRWWHYTTVYLGFFFWFILPIAVIIASFIAYPFITMSIPTIAFCITLLVIIAYDASTSNPFREIYKPVGTLL